MTVANVALEAAGLKKPELPDSQKPPRSIHLTLHAASNLNADPAGRGMALVFKLYKLRSTAAFVQASSSALIGGPQEREALGQDLVEVRELALIPGQKYEFDEKLPYDVGYIAVAGLFRAPASGRWKYAFESAQVEKSGVTIGVHACAMSVTSGLPVGADQDAQLLSSVRCP